MEQHQQAKHRDSAFQLGIDTQRVFLSRDESREEEGSQAHATHEGAEQHTHRDGRRADDQSQKLEPDDFIDQGSTPAPDEEQEHPGQDPARLRGSGSG